MDKNYKSSWTATTVKDNTYRTGLMVNNSLTYGKYVDVLM